MLIYRKANQRSEENLNIEIKNRKQKRERVYSIIEIGSFFV